MSTITAGGTPLYMAPELLNPIKFGETKSRPTKPADIYAFGMVIYEVLTGFDPFYDQNTLSFELGHRVEGGLRPTKPSNAEDIGFGKGTWELVTSCWKAKSTKRLPIKQVLEHLEHVSTVVGLTSRNHPESNSSGTVPLEFSILQQILPHPLRPYFPLMPILHIPVLRIRTRPPSGLQHLSPVLRNPEIVLWLWQDLASTNPVPIHHRLLTALVEREENRDIALKFRGQDAVTIINIIDKVSRFQPSMSATATHSTHLSISL